MAKKPEEPKDQEGQPGLLELYFIMQDIRPWLSNDSIRALRSAGFSELANALERLQKFLLRSFGSPRR